MNRASGAKAMELMPLLFPSMVRSKAPSNKRHSLIEQSTHWPEASVKALPAAMFCPSGEKATERDASALLLKVRTNVPSDTRNSCTPQPPFFFKQKTAYEI